MSAEKLTFNGIDARTGDYLLHLDPEELVAVACGEQLDKSTVAELKRRRAEADSGHYGAVEGVDIADISQAGWGIVMGNPKAGSPEAMEQEAIIEALRPLLELRQAQAAAKDERLYKNFIGPTGFWAEDTKLSFLKRHKEAPGPANPQKVPYYLLIVGDPGTISYRFQSQLGIQRAVGRLHFDRVEDYHNYARSVVAAETKGLALARRASFFGVANPDDLATQSSARNLIGPLADSLSADPRFAGWSIERKLREEATHTALGGMLNTDQAPALLFTASHGMGFPKDDELQQRHQGALLCQDWPGPKGWRGKPIPEDFYFAGEHLSADANLLGSVAFLFACYGAGTPELDEFAKQAYKERSQITSKAFVAGLPKAMLNRPKGGALAVVGHVERAWGHSFMWEGSGERGRSGQQIAVFESALRAMMDGMPVGAAMGYFSERYAELGSELSVLVEEHENGGPVDDAELAGMWTANNDARGYAILGDPAVRLPLAVPAPIRSRELIALDVGPREVAAAALPEGAAPVLSDRVPAVLIDVAPIEADAVVDVHMEGGAQSFGVLSNIIFSKDDKADKGDKGADKGEKSSIQRFVSRIGDSLGQALDNATSLEVSTWVTDDLGKASFDRQSGKMIGAELRAFTRVSIDGDTVVCLPERDGEVDREVWDIHASMVRQAQETRAELMKALVSAAASFAKLGG